MKDSYDVRIYEDNGGGVHAVIEQDSAIVNVVPHLEMERDVTGAQIIAAAKEGFPFADEYDPVENSGESMLDSADWLENNCDLIAEVHGTQTTFYYEKMSVQGRHLFGDIDRPRLFVDMDGTLARFHDEVQYLERMYEPNFFKNLKPFLGAVETIREIMRVHPNWEVYILSAAISGDPPGCEKQKNAWLDMHLPEIDRAHRLFPPIGTDKSMMIPGGIQGTDILLDDYNKNLEEWRAAGGISVKFVNNINDRALNGPRWDGWRLRHDNGAIFNVEHLVRVLEISVAPNATQSTPVQKPPRGPHL